MYHWNVNQRLQFVVRVQVPVLRVSKCSKVSNLPPLLSSSDPQNMQITRRHSGRSVVWKFTDRCTTCSWWLGCLDAYPKTTLTRVQRFAHWQFTQNTLQAILCSCLLFKLSKTNSAQQRTTVICYSAFIKSVKQVKPVLCTNLIWATWSWISPSNRVGEASKDVPLFHSRTVRG